ncbi:MAG: branched-chain amino acid ABC transporter permease [Actinomycetota bacterium]
MGDCIDGVTRQFWDQTVNGLTTGSIYAMIALGYTMVYGVLQLINFAHSEVFMVSTVVALHALKEWFGVTAALHGATLIVVFLGVLLASALASGVTALTIERFAYRPLRRRGAPRLSFLISAIGASLAIQYLFSLMDGRHYLLFYRLPNLMGPSPRQVPRFVESERLFTIFGTPVTNKHLLVVGVSLVMLFLLDRFVNRTRIGRGIRAVAQDPEAASMMGVNIDRVVVTTFFIGGVMAGAAGLLFVVYLNAAANWPIGFLPGIKAFSAAVLGGIGNIRGAMLGGVLLGLAEKHGGACFGTQWETAISFVVLVLVLMFRPSGLLGEQVRS